MFNQTDFGKRVREFRTRKNYSQREIALRIGVSEQAVSKWENGDCLPDIYNLKLLAQILHISVDSLLDTEMQNSEKIVETINVCGARFDIVERPETILAGKIIYAKDFPDIDSFYIRLILLNTFFNISNIVIFKKLHFMLLLNLILKKNNNFCYCIFNSI